MSQENEIEVEKRSQTTDFLPSDGAPCSASSELVENLQEWGEHFREQQHGATLTILRARKTITDQATRIAWLESQWEETKELLHAVGSGKMDSRIRQAGAEILSAARQSMPRRHPTIERNAVFFEPNADVDAPAGKRVNN